MKRLTDADEERGWRRLRFPPPWWELPTIVALFAVLGHFIGHSLLETFEFGGIGLLLFLMRYGDGERALLHRLDRRLEATQRELDSLRASMREIEKPGPDLLPGLERAPKG